MMYKAAVLFVFSAFPLSVVAQTTEKPVDTYIADLEKCAGGLKINASGELLGSVREVYVGKKTSAQDFKFESVGQFLSLMPEKDRLEAYKLYIGCIAPKSSQKERGVRKDNYEKVLACMPAAHRPQEPEQPTVEQLTTSLVLLSFAGHQSCVDELIDAGADINGMGNDKTFRGPSLHIALTQKNWNLATHLIDRGANPNLYYYFSSGPATALSIAKGNYAPSGFIDYLEYRGGKYN